MLFNVDHLPRGSLVASGIGGVRIFADDIMIWPYGSAPRS